MKRVTTVWPAALYEHPKRFVNKYRPDLYHPELHLVRFSATVGLPCKENDTRRKA